MTKLYSTTFLLLIMALVSCTSGKKAFKQGNYYEAVTKSVDRLRKNTSHNKSAEILRKSYPLAIKTLEKQAKNILNNNEMPFKYREAVKAYEKINFMSDDILRSPGALQIIPKPKEYYAKVLELKPKAAKESYDAGIAALNENSRQRAKDAYYYFADANNFVDGYKDVKSKIKEAKFEATLKVVVEQIPVFGRYNISGDFFQDNVEEFLHVNFTQNDFVKFYTPRQVEREDLHYVDQILKLQFDDFVVGETHINRNTETVSRDSVKVGTIKTDRGKKEPIYNTVYAKLTTYKKVIISKGIVSMRIIDVGNDALLTHKKFNGTFEWFTAWGSFNGDERALTTEQLDICRQTDVPPPPRQDLFIEFTKPIFNDLTTEIQRFYRNY